MKRYKLGMVAAEFNYDITSMMVERARSQAEFLEVEIARTIMVPGVFDMPLAVKRLLEEKEIDAVITLGAVIEGETEHDDVVISHASRKIADLSLEFNKPVSFGVTGPGMTRLQAVDRIEKGREAVDVAVKMLKRLGK
ncbi:MAG: 6,7-dimethyl-8-ribityllumazine synthase [Methanomassiliicoccaceae archaeon]|jgi:6,7-dimethyl-8-ribityllumazine synthase|nr:6,7-dimethyl-8-ribityllumazine synthase [Methanomassiliicoccaceae archaeon]